MSYNHCYHLMKEFWPDFQATEKDFRNPSQDFLMRFYEKFFEECGFYELSLQPIPDLLWPDLLTKSLPIVSTCEYLLDIFPQFKGTQLGVEDIIESQPKRCLKQIEFLTNFLAFVDCHSGRHSSLAYDYASDAAIEKDNATKEMDEMKEKLNEIAMRKANFTSQLKLADEELSATVVLWDSVHAEYGRRVEECKLLNEALAEEIQENSLIEKEIEKELEEIESLRDKIVQSPDAVSREIAELSVRKRDIESDQIHLRNRAKQMMLLESNTEQMTTMIKYKLPQVNELAENLMFLRDLEKGLIEDEAAVKSAKEKADTVAERCHLIERDIAHLEQEREKHESHSASEYASMENLIQELLKHKEEAEHEHIQFGAEQVVIAQQIHQLREEIKEEDKEKEEYINEFKDSVEEIKNGVITFVKGFCDAASSYNN